MDATVTPRPILARQPQHQRPDTAARPRPSGVAAAGSARPAATEDVTVPLQDGTGGDDEPQPGEALDRQRPGQQRQPRPIRSSQPRMSPILLALGDSQLVAQDQDLGVFPPHLPPGQAQQRHGAGADEEDRFQVHKPKIIARAAGHRPAHRPPGPGPGPGRGASPRICPGGKCFRHPQGRPGSLSGQVSRSLVRRPAG